MPFQLNRLWLGAIAIAILPLAAAAAEPGLRIYGRVDIGPLYQSNAKDGNSVVLNEVSANRLGFIGEEDLGGGLSAFFRLENRFYLDSGAERTGKRLWSDKSWVGLRSKTFGALSAGRVLTVGNWIVGGGDFEAMTDSIGSINSRKGRIENNIDNSLFYESPWFTPSAQSKVRFLAQYALPEVKGVGKPYSAGFQFQQGQFMLDAGYQHDVYKDGSAPATEDRKSNSLFAGAAYDFGSFVLKSTLASSRGYKGSVSDDSPYRMKTASLSLNKEFGAWKLGLMGTRKLETDLKGVSLPTIDKVAVGFWYRFSKRTMFMPTIAYERLSGAYVAGKNGYGVAKDKPDNLYIQLGFRHEF